MPLLYKVQELELIPGVKGTPAFPSREAYDRWAREFYEAVKPELDKWDRARAASELAAMHHIVR